MAEPKPTQRPTTPRRVLAAVGVGAAAGWVLSRALLLAGAALPVLGASAWLPLLLLTAGTGWLAVTTRRAVRRHREDLDARVAVARLLIGKASVLAGAALAGGYLALALVALGGWPAPLAQGRVLHGGLATLTGALWALMGWLLERACRIPQDPSDGAGDTKGHDVS